MFTLKIVFVTRIEELGSTDKTREQHRRANNSTTYAVARLKKIKRTSLLFELACLLVPLNHVARSIAGVSTAS
jgi:hypothetical protein